MSAPSGYYTIGADFGASNQDTGVVLLVSPEGVISQILTTPSPSEVTLQGPFLSNAEEPPFPRATKPRLGTRKSYQQTQRDLPRFLR